MTVTAYAALTLTDPFTGFGFAPDRYAEIIFYRCHECGEHGPVGRALLGGLLRDLPTTEQAAYTWPTAHYNTTGHEFSRRITISRAPGCTHSLRHLSKTPRSARHS